VVSHLPIFRYRGERQKPHKEPTPAPRVVSKSEYLPSFKKGLEWRGLDLSGVPLAYPNTRGFSRDLHSYWVDRYIKQLHRGFDDPGKSEDGGVMQILKPKMSQRIKIPPYEEPEDENLFLLFMLGDYIGSSQPRIL